ncbi:N-acetyl-gamma-glutamyl-phosphate reductase [Methylacidiphilum caldifontis]|uniref:N-acetyl-gamma-glutamyl-phosphate reductase n=1 Tax=Methylacidiphilum caldifontis TaxID=2795386 RepID=A0A4Y8P9F1_9BACT|nr:N-acetyl-gamma-glutamyl-phosphate reductase [Methylacidiphilum caldifontis]TFE67054.1 N-acetyl-gamma-glutamyl-phosphate reductase [Methylacidiphilum caldifontis]
MSSIRVGIIGASGYAGEELIRLLIRHPGIDLRVITSRQYKHRSLESVYPDIGSFRNIQFDDPDNLEKIDSQTDVVFLALPHGAGMHYAQFLYHRAKVVIDLSADFRLKDPSDYEIYYKFSHPFSDLLEEAVYALPEIYQDQIVQSRLLAMPGCYPTGVLLPVAPFLKKGWIDPSSIEIVALSGSTGAGKTLDSKLLFSELADNLRPYGFPGHRHTPEIEQQITKLAQNRCSRVLFLPILAPLRRGILLSIVASLTEEISQQDAEGLALHFYKEAPFVKILTGGIMPELRYVLGSNYLYFSTCVLADKKKLLLLSVIDNLGKGAAGQAIQVMNIKFGLDQTLGLIP